MSLGLIGRKLGMTRVFDDSGNTIPVTVLSVPANRVVQVKTKATDGYDAIQVTFGNKKANRVNKPTQGHCAKAGVEAGLAFHEFPLTAEEVSKFKAGSEITVEVFAAGNTVDVTGTSKGKGYAGAIKRHNFSSNRATHGNSLSHNAPGSIGQRQDPGRVFPGKRMSGHMGDEKVTTQNLEVVRIDVERGLLLIKGAIPGSKGGNVVVRPAVKAGA